MPGTLSSNAIHDAGVVLSRFSFGSSALSRNSTARRRATRGCLPRCGGAREYCRRRVFRQLYALSELAIFTVPVNLVPWLPLHREKATFIPVGANCPEGVPSARDDTRVAKTVAVYSITGGTRALIEADGLGSALRRASSSVGQVHVVLCGCGSRQAEQLLLGELAGADVRLETFGLLRPEKVSRTLSAADVLLFVRGHISSRRGSAVAGIACGCPSSGIRAQKLRGQSRKRAFPQFLSAIGRPLRPRWKRSFLTVCIADRRPNTAQKSYFSWLSIAERFAAELRLRNKTPLTSAAIDSGGTVRI